MDIQRKPLSIAPALNGSPFGPIAAPEAPSAPEMAVDTFKRGVDVVAAPVTDLVQSADDKREFHQVATKETTDVFALRSGAYVPSTAKSVIDASKTAAQTLKGATPVAPAAPTGLWARMGTGLGVLDIGAGLMQTVSGISQLRVGKERDGWVNVTGGAAFVASSALYLAGSTVLGPIAAAAACIIPGVNEMAYGLQQHDPKKQLSAGALLAGGAGFTAMAGMAVTGLGAGATVLGLPVLTALGVGTSALLAGRALVNNWGAIKNLAGRLADKVGLG